MVFVAFTEGAQVDGLGGADLRAFAEALKPVQKELSKQLDRRGVSAPAAGAVEEEAAAPVAVAAGGGAGGGAGPQGGPAISGNIQNREDAIRTLDRVIEYFNKYEPSSPIPLLLHRAKRLVSKSFMEIMQDLAPDGLAQAQLMGGVTGTGGGGGGGGGEGAAPAPAAGGSDDGW